MIRKGILLALASFLLIPPALTAAAQKKNEVKKQEPKQDNKKSREAELGNRALRKWLDEDVAYIITDEEKATFKALKTDEEREQFIENFASPRSIAGKRRKRVQGRALQSHRLCERPFRFRQAWLEDGSRSHLHSVWKACRN